MAAESLSKNLDEDEKQANEGELVLQETNQTQVVVFFNHKHQSEDIIKQVRTKISQPVVFFHGD